MARQPKQGLDYYPRDVTFLKDRKFRKVRIKYGAIAVMVYEALLELIYADKGYYVDYSDSNKSDVIWEVAECLQGKYQPSHETIADIIEDLVDCGLFSRYHFEFKTITSRRIQRTYYSATVERKAILIDFDIWMLDEKEMSELSRSSFILQNFINRPINGVNRPKNGVNRPINTQSKVKESKVNNNNPPTPLLEDSDNTPAVVEKTVKAKLREVWERHTLKPELKNAVKEWIKYKTEKKQSYKPKGLNNLLTQIKTNADKYGEAAVIALIGENMANNYAGITWDRLSQTGGVNTGKYEQKQYKTAFERTLDTAKASIEKYRNGEEDKIDI